MLVILLPLAAPAACAAEQIGAGGGAGKVPAAAEVKSITARPTPMFVLRDGKLRRIVEVSVVLTAPATELVLRAEAAGQSNEVTHRQPAAFSFATAEIDVPDAPEPLDLKLTASVGGRAKEITFRVPPQKKWRVYVAASSHTDIGYTDVQPKCAEQHCKNIDTAIDLDQRYPDFCWNLETAWQAQSYIHLRSGRRLEDFFRYAREGKIGIQALYCNELTGLCSPEEACRLTWVAHALCRAKGIPYRSAMISDVPSQEASLPMILAGAGIRYFSSGVNSDRAYNFVQMQKKCPCWWEGPDGSRVLMMYTYQYAQADQWALNGSFDAARARVLEKLQEYDARTDYPYDAVFLHGAVSDNQPLNPRLAENVARWNARYAYPKLILSPNAAFFEYIEQHYGDKLPAYRGSAGTYWEDGAASSARETAMDRTAHEELSNGEKFLALADRIGGTRHYQPDAVNQAWRNCILYDEHTWGADCSVKKPESEMTKAQWKIKQQFALDAAQQAKTILDQGSRALASLVRTDGPGLVVFNPTSWPRTDVVLAKLPEGMGPVDPDVASLVTPQGTLLLVKDVPACGYRVLKLGPQPKPNAPQPADGAVIESRYYRVRFDPASGGIASIRDKETDRELVDPDAPWQLNQYIYVTGGDGNTRIIEHPDAPAPQLKPVASGKATLRRLRSPGVGECMEISDSGAMTSGISSTVRVWEDIKRIDIVNSFRKQQTYAKEAVYFAFPFAATQPTFRYEAPAAIVNANRDMLPGACLDWFTVQHFVEVADGRGAVAWATPDAPIVCFQDINRGQWRQQLSLLNGRVYAYVMNNYWFTNYLAAQGGDYSFRFALTSRPKTDNVASARFGWAVSNPLLAVAVGANPQGPLPSEPTSLLSVAEPGVIVITAKQADQDGALVVRLWELTGQQTTAHLRLDRRIPAAKATACNLVEDPEGPLELRDGVVAVPIRGRGLATVRIE
jgi:hypothetical protein